MTDDDSDDAPDLPEPEPAAPRHPGAAVFGPARDNVPGPFEPDLDEQAAKWAYWLSTPPEKVREARVERMRLRHARIARRREERRCPLPAPGDAPAPRPDPHA